MSGAVNQNEPEISLGKTGYFDVSRIHQISMSIMLRGRDKNRLPYASKFKDMPLMQVNDLDTSQYVDTKASLEEAKSIFSKAYKIEKSLINSYISAGYQKNNDWKHLYNRMFHSVKRCVRILSNDYTNAQFFDQEMKKQYFTMRIADDFLEAFEVSCGSDPGKREEFVRGVLQEIGYDHLIGSSVGKSDFIPRGIAGLPITAPELWSNRGARQSITPVEFARDVYRPWIGRGLTRSHIRRLDINLYQALNKWIKRHPDDIETREIDRLIPDRAAQDKLEIEELGITKPEEIDARLSKAPNQHQERLKRSLRSSSLEK